jgi:hypothetical protein
MSDRELNSRILSTAAGTDHRYVSDLALASSGDMIGVRAYCRARDRINELSQCDRYQRVVLVLDAAGSWRPR